ncbi:hypothetical protein QJS10_CPA08g00906 [Acorus calamus]|uniref:GST N-terminal domain-containing protein n=1 Tax=Acorus calamus TaxID=4465 RepID=A0AAV9EA08_ACOCL|nr:hypothetical protein QJS10_CPA08g00906 [Acorus calamus]
MLNDEVVEKFPFLVDPNTGISMYESGESSNSMFVHHMNIDAISNLLSYLIIIVPWFKVCGRQGDIVKYLFQQYAHGKNPSTGLLESTLFTGWMPTILRAGRGMSLWERAPVEPPLQKLELFSVENSPFARIVREALCELELPYILHNVGEGSSKTDFLLQLSGSRKVPYLIDPNTETQLGDYKKILSYLFETYSASNKMPS